MKKEAINTFGEGLIMDLNPLTTPNNILTNCLNGTIVTYNGNEFVLQNDMGNGKVETAKLPSGYIPLGVKEYGGIIYIVSFNPETKKGQIGSFPSPERNFTSAELGNPEMSINSNSYFSNGQITKSYEKFEVLGKDNEGEEIKLNPGDQFGLIINPGNTDIHSIVSTKGNLKTLKLKVGIIDSNNNLSFITDTLEPLDDGFWAFTMELGAEANNVYKNKTSGKLVITSELESIKEFNVSAESSLENGQYTIKVEYDSDAETESIMKGVYIECIDGLSNSIRGFFNKEDGKFFNIVTSKKEKITYNVTPFAVYGLLNSMKRTGSINTAYVYSGLLNLTEWRYFVDMENEEVIISWGLEYYPKKDHFINNVSFKLYDMSDNMDVVSVTSLNIREKNSYNGTFLDTFKFGTDLIKNKLYFVIVDVEETNDKGVVTHKPAYRFLYTSPTFNSLYTSSESNLDYNLNKPTINLEVGATVTSSATNYGTTTSIGDTSPVSLVDRESFKATIYRDAEVKITPEVTFKTNNDVFDFDAKDSPKYTITPTVVPNSVQVVNVDNVDIKSGDSSNLTIQGDTIIPDTYNASTPTLGYSFADNTLKVREISEIVATAKSEIRPKDGQVLEPYFSDKNYSKIFGFSTLRVGALNKFWTYYAWTLENRDSKSGLGGHHSENWVALRVLSDAYNWDENEADGCIINRSGSWNYNMNDIVPFYSRQSWRFPPSILFFTTYRADGKSQLLSQGNNTNYAFVQWRDSSEQYHMLNYRFDKWNGGNGTECADKLNSIFSKVYVAQKGVVDAETWVPDNCSYNNKYEITGQIRFNSRTSDTNDHNYFIAGTETVISPEGLQTKVKNCLLNYGIAEAEADTLVTQAVANTNSSVLNFNNIRVLTAKSSYSETYTVKLKSPDISYLVGQYSNPATVFIGNTFATIGNKLSLTDGNGKAYDSSLPYYVNNGLLFPMTANSTTIGNFKVAGVFRVKASKDVLDFNELVIDPLAMQSNSLVTNDSITIGEDWSRSTTIPTKKIIWS